MENRRSITILLVEDNAVISLFGKRIIGKHGFEVITSFTGEEAVVAIKNTPHIDLVLMDIDLGDGMDGTETALKILDIVDIPIVFLTSHFEKEYVDKVKQITKYGYVLKDSGKFVLIESINMAMELHATKSKLQKSDDRFRKIYENVRNIAVQGYFEDGTVHFWNKASEELYGYTEEEALGSKLYDLIIPEPMIPDVKKAVEHMFKTGISQSAEELTLKNKADQPISVYSNHTMISIEDREAEMYCIDIDMSPIKEAEQKLYEIIREKKTNKRELQLQAKNIVHMISAIISQKDSFPESEDVQSIIKELIPKINAVTEIYTLLFSLELTDAVRLDDYIGKIIASFRITADDICFKTDFEEVLLPADTVATIGFITTELITNSIKHAFSGNEEKAISINLSQETGFLKICYSDNGSGLPESIDLQSTDASGITQMLRLADQIDGRLRIETGEGFVCELILQI